MTEALRAREVGDGAETAPADAGVVMAPVVNDVDTAIAATIAASGGSADATYFGASVDTAIDEPPAGAHTVAADPWAAILEAGAALLQGLAASRQSGKAGDAAAPAPPIAIERDPVTGQASLRLPLPDAALLKGLAKALEPWLR